MVMTVSGGTVGGGGGLAVQQRVQIRVVEAGSFHEMRVHSERLCRQTVGVAPAVDLGQPEGQEGMGCGAGVRNQQEEKQKHMGVTFTRKGLLAMTC